MVILSVSVDNIFQKVLTMSVSALFVALSATHTAIFEIPEADKNEISFYLCSHDFYKPCIKTSGLTGFDSG